MRKNSLVHDMDKFKNCALWFIGTQGIWYSLGKIRPDVFYTNVAEMKLGLLKHTLVQP